MKVGIVPVAEAKRTELDGMAKTYFAEILPEGPPYYPAALDRYWAEPGRHPYLIHGDNRAIGFATNSPGGMAFWQQCLIDCENTCEVIPGAAKTSRQCGSFTFRIER